MSDGAADEAAVPLRLVSFEAEDGLELDGAWYRCDPNLLSDRLVVMTHGAWMNFYTGPQRFLPQRLVPAGFDCLAMNNRDRDLGGMHPPTGRCFGMLRCLFEDMLPDLAGALAWARRTGYRRFVLVCHSWSGMRVALYISRRGPDGIEAVAMLSPPVSMATVQRHWVDDYEGLVAQARSLTEAGRPMEILVDRPGARFPLVASAATVRSIWTHPSQMEDYALVEGLRMPLLITVGEREAEQAPIRAHFERIASTWAGPVTRSIIPDAGHYYLENPDGLADVVVAWLADRGSGALQADRSVC